MCLCVCVCVCVCVFVCVCVCTGQGEVDCGVDSVARSLRTETLMIDKTLAMKSPVAM